MSNTDSTPKKKSQNINTKQANHQNLNSWENKLLIFSLFFSNKLIKLSNHNNRKELSVQQ